MTGGIKGMYDDYDRYVALCEKFNEEAIYFYDDWYAHFWALKDRNGG